MKSLKLRTVLCAAVCLSPTLHGAIVDSSWQGGGSGTLLWETNGNWSPAVYPNEGTDHYVATIGDATGDRVIQTSGAISVARLIMNQTSALGSNTLKLGGNLLVTQLWGGTASGLSNTTNDASKLVLDLNGHSLQVNGPAGTFGSVPYLTIKGGGVFSINQFYHTTGHTIIDSGVTVKVVGTDVALQANAAVTWNAGSTFHYAKNTDTTVTLNHSWTKAEGFYNLTLGSADNTVSSKITFANTNIGAGLYVNGNVRVVGFGTEGNAARFSIGTGKMNVAGDFVDEGTDGENYGTGTIIFNGGASTQRTVSIGRQELTNHFQIGESATVAGNIALGQDLTTTGNVTVLKEGTLDLSTFTLAAENISLQSSGSVRPTLAFTFGLNDSGLIAANSTLTLTGALLNITYDNSGWSGGDLTLFEYGSIAGTAPTLADFTILTSGNFTYDELVIGPNSIYLRNVIPEPTSTALLAIAGAGMVWNSIRRRNGTKG